jgi:hypothetical protein
MVYSEIHLEDSEWRTVNKTMIYLLERYDVEVLSGLEASEE